MRSIPDAVQHTIEEDGFLHFGLANAVLNLTKTAKFIRPLVETRTKKKVSVSAITMALSRLRVGKRMKNAELKAVKLDAITATKNLVEITYDKTTDNVRALAGIEKETRNKNKYIVATLGVNELMIITEADMISNIKKAFPTRAKAVIEDLVAIGVQFNAKYVEQVGIVYTLIQQLTFQNINVIEFSSTYTELTFYLKKKDLKLAFDTLYDQFM